MTMVRCSVNFSQHKQTQISTVPTQIINSEIKLNVLRKLLYSYRPSKILCLSCSQCCSLKPIIFSKFSCLIQVKYFALMMMMKHRIIWSFTFNIFDAEFMMSFTHSLVLELDNQNFQILHSFLNKWPIFMIFFTKMFSVLISLMQNIPEKNCFFGL